MSENYRFILASNQVAKTDCPYCAAKKHWQHYIDTQTGEVLPVEHGRCDNEVKCGAWVTPYDTGYAKELFHYERDGITQTGMDWNRQVIKEPIRKPTLPPVHFDRVAFSETLVAHNYKRNNFIQNLAYRVPYPFTEEQLTRVIELYLLGTVPDGKYAGALTIPFIDDRGNTRAVQVKQFDDSNHTKAQTFLHSLEAETYKNRGKDIPAWLAAYQQQDTKKISCLFGAQLLKQYPLNPVALVEAPKTAIYGSLYFGPPSNPRNLLWLAVYSKSTFTLDKLKALKGRRVIVFPDLSNDGSTFREWQEKAQRFEMELPGTRFIFSDLLERMATAKQKIDGADLADVIIQHDWREYQEFQSEVENIATYDQPDPIELFVPAVAKIYPKNHKEQPPFDRVPRKWQSWLTEIEKLEKALAGISLPSIPLKIKGCSTISEPGKFIQAHLATIKANDGNPIYLPYLERLRDFRLVLDEHNEG